MVIREKYRNKRAKILADCTCMAINARSEAEKTLHLSPGTMALAGTGGMTAATLNAVASGDLQKTIGEDLLSPIYKLFVGISTGLAVVMIAYHLLCLFGGSPKKTEIHIDSIKRIFAVWVILNMLGAIFKFIAPIVSGNGFAGNQSKGNSFS